VGNQAATTLIGELYVTYTIRLSTPQLNIAAISKSSSKYITPSAGVTKTAPLGTAQTVSGGLPLSVSAIAANATTKIIASPGQYLLDLFATGTGLATGAVTLSADDASNTVSQIADIANAAATLETATVLMNVVRQGYFTFSAAGATTLTALAIRAARYAPSSTQSPGSVLNELEVAGED